MIQGALFNICTWYFQFSYTSRSRWKRKGVQGGHFQWDNFEFLRYIKIELGAIHKIEKAVDASVLLQAMYLVELLIFEFCSNEL